MELSIDYACPECHRLTAVDLRKISPGGTPNCNECQIPLILTAEALGNLSRDLRCLPLNEPG